MAGMTNREVLQRQLAGSLDHPSVYMGGPSHGNMRNANRLLEILERDGWLDLEKLKAEYVHPKVGK